MAYSVIFGFDQATQAAFGVEGPPFKTEMYKGDPLPDVGALVYMPGYEAHTFVVTSKCWIYKAEGAIICIVLGLHKTEKKPPDLKVV